MNNILIIRMLELGDIASIAIPAIRHVRKTNPDANITCLTHGQGGEVLRIVEPNVTVLTLENGVWPENILQALEAFIGVAERVIGTKYDSIINLDIGFMPCVLARFLKDAGEPVVGNYLSVSLQDLLTQIQNQTLQAEYVNQSQQYMQSTFNNIFKWHSRWWESESLFDFGYPEFYLKKCCGWGDMDFDPHLLKSETIVGVNDKRVYLAIHEHQHPYAQISKLTELLQENGLTVEIDDENSSIETRLHRIANSKLVVCLANAVYAFAAGVGASTLLIPLLMDPRILMPEYAADQAMDIPNAESLSESILSVFESE